MNEQTIAKIKDFRAMLKELTNGLLETAKAENRSNYTLNGLLEDYYGLIGQKLHTFNEWKDMNYSINKGEHAYHFWGTPITNQNGNTYCPVEFLFSEKQVRLNSYTVNA